MAAAKNSILEKIAAAQHEKIRASKKVNFAEMPLLDMIPAVTPKFKRPEHLAPVAVSMDKAIDSQVFLAFSVPPRHGKSELAFHFIAKFIARNPHLNVAYCTYTSTLAEKRSVQIKEICQRMGVEFDKNFDTRADWRTAKGGFFMARGAGGPLTGEGVDLLIVDDPYKDRASAESPVIRENIEEWWTGVALTRLQPNASAFVFHTRWVQDDLVGQLIEDPDWEYVNLKCIDDNGNLLWPGQYKVEEMLARKRMVGPYDWASMYQGEPRPRGGAVFNNEYTYIELPKNVKYTIGIDLAYSANTHSDFSVAVVLAHDEAKNSYVVDCRRLQCEAPKFATVLRELRMAYRHPPIYWYVGGTEKSMALTFRDSFGIPVRDIPAREDKFSRAQACAAAWNAGRIFIPEGHRPWRDSFTNEVLNFTGLGDKHDDVVDALVAAYVPLTTKQVSRGMITTRMF